MSFQRDIKPILETACIKCHGRGRSQGGFSLETRETVIKGGRSGKAVIMGQSADSYLIELVSGLNPGSVMPQRGSRLTTEQISLLRAWIDQGLLWDEKLSFNRPAPANLTPRKPNLPAPASADASVNPVDLLLTPYFAARGTPPSSPVSDRILLRRLFLDTIGLLPSPSEQQAFEADTGADKTERWVQKLLGRNASYAAHWLSFWNDALRNDYQGTGYIDGGRRQITEWLYAALINNTPFDRFVAQLVNPESAAEGFINGIIWRGAVNASQTPQMQAAQNIAHVFLGVNLKCASCHDSFISDWTLADAYGMAGIYANGALEMVRCDKPTGKTAPVKFLFPQLGSIDAGMDQKQRRTRLAEIMTQKENGRLTRTIVNRLWARFMGHGLVEPVDEMDKPAWSQDLLDWLAEDLAENHYDLKKTITVILTSRAYRLPSRDAFAAGDFVFQGPQVRRMGAEQFLDAVCNLSRAWPEKMANTNLATIKPVATEAMQNAADDTRHIRSALVSNDALMTVLGRPNREVVVTRRSEEATTLQALELTNGAALAGLLRAGARNWAALETESSELPGRIFREALGRAPGDAELKASLELIGNPVKTEGLEDLLWTVAMLPEFQLIY